MSSTTDRQTREIPLTNGISGESTSTEVDLDTNASAEYDAEVQRLVEQMKEEQAQEVLRTTEELDYEQLSEPFGDDWDSLPEEIKQRYYDQHSRENYIEWCRQNPLPKKKRTYVVDRLIPAYQCHVVCGESGAQKTSILLTLLADWMLGKDVLGRKSLPVPMLYIAYDRGREATEETFETLGLDHRLFGYVEVTNKDRELDVAEFVAKLKEQNPSVELFVIDGMFLMAPDVIKIKTKKGERELRDPYKVHGAWLQEIDALCNKLKITIIGVTHASKGGGSEHLGKRTRILGTVANAATTGTTIICDPVESNERRTRVPTTASITKLPTAQIMKLRQ
jgi:RecA-family ATPase